MSHRPPNSPAIGFADLLTTMGRESDRHFDCYLVISAELDEIVSTLDGSEAKGIYVQFAWRRPDWFLCDVPRDTLGYHQGSDVQLGRLAFVRVKDAPLHPARRYDDDASLAKFDPLVKTYRRGDERAAAADACFILGKLCHLPRDWPLRANAFSLNGDYCRTFTPILSE